MLSKGCGLINEKDKIIKELQEKYPDGIYIPDGKFYKEYSGLYCRILKHFKRLSDALDAANIKHKVFKKFTREEVVSELIRLANVYGELSGPIIDKYGAMKSTVICRHFKTIQQACEELTLPFKEKTHKYVSKEKLDVEIFRIIEEFGYVSKPLMEKHSIYGPKIVNRIYGNFGKMYEALGITRHPSGRSPTDSQLIEDFLRIYNKYKTISKEIIVQESKYSITCFRDRFGGLNRIKEMLGINIPASNESPSATYAIQKVSEFLNEKPQKEKTFSWLKNPETNYKLRIDAFFPEHNLAVEYNGPQHYRLYKRYYSSEEKLEKRKKLDKLKNDLLKEHGIKVVWIHYKDKITNKYLKANFT